MYITFFEIILGSGAFRDITFTRQKKAHNHVREDDVRATRGGRGRGCGMATSRVEDLQAQRLAHEQVSI